MFSNQNAIDEFDRKNLKILPERLRSISLNPLIKLWYSWCNASRLTHGEAQSLLNRHIQKEYSGRKAAHKATNLPRQFWQKEEMGWDTFMEAVRSMDPTLAHLGIEPRDPNGIYRMIEVNLLETPPKNHSPVTLKTVKNKDALVVHSSEIYQSVNGWLAYILRRILYEYKITWGYVDKQFNDYVNNPEFNSKHKKSSPSSIKGNLKVDLKKSTLTWNSFLELLLALGFLQYDLTLVMNRNKGTHEKKVVISWRW